MSSVILYGDNIRQSREKLNLLLEEHKKQNKEIVRLDGQSVSLNEIKVALESGSLFGQNKLGVIEGLLTRPKSKEKESIISYLQEIPNLPELIIWEGKSLTKIQLRGFKNYLTDEFKIPLLVFKFLDSFCPSNQKTLLNLLVNIKAKDKEFVFYMLSRRVSQLLVAKDLGEKGLAMAPWQKYRVLGQAKKFNDRQLGSIYKGLLDIDTNIKTGGTMMSLDMLVDLLVINM